MRQNVNQRIESFTISIENIGSSKSKPELEFKNKKILEKLKKSKAELLEEAFSDAFNPESEA